MTVALPFLLGETSISDYIIRSKLTGAGRNGIAFSEEFWDYLASMQHLSIFWTFVPNEFYYDRNGLAKYARIGMLGLNVFHFFIRKGCLKKCLVNLFDFI